MKVLCETDGYLIKFTPIEFTKLKRRVKFAKKLEAAEYNLKDVERITILDALESTDYHMAKTTKLLGLPRPISLRRKLKRYRAEGINIPIIKAGRKKRNSHGRREED